MQERRAETRIPCSEAVGVSWTDRRGRQHRKRGNLEDISYSGICLLLDEPIANLDINYQHQTLTMVKGLVQEFHLAALITIHDLGLAARYCHRLVLLHKGRILVEGSPAEVLQGDYLRTVFGVEAQLYRDPLGQWALSVQPLTTPTNGIGQTLPS